MAEVKAQPAKTQETERKTSASDTVEVTITGGVLHDKKFYGASESLTLSSADAERLVALGHAKLND